MPTPEKYLSLMHDDYIQHNPDAARFQQINHTSGKKGMQDLLEAMHLVGYHPGPPPPKPGEKAQPMPMPKSLRIAECDLVFELHELPAPDPMNPGKTYTVYGFDLYRVKDGKLYEHWDDARITTPPSKYLLKTLAELRAQGPAPAKP